MIKKKKIKAGRQGGIQVYTGHYNNYVEVAVEEVPV